MRLESLDRPNHLGARVLQAYLLGSVGFESALAFQRRLLYQVAGDPDQGALVLCEHPPLITVGRQGSSADILDGATELRARRWQVRWVNRGGGCVLHLPGQLAIYPILALNRLDLDLHAYLIKLQAVLINLLRDFEIRAEPSEANNEILAGGRPIATIGVAVRQWVCYYGAILNVNPDLLPFRGIRNATPGAPGMTSLRESGAARFVRNSCESGSWNTSLPASRSRARLSFPITPRSIQRPLPMQSLPVLEGPSSKDGAGAHRPGLGCPPGSNDACPVGTRIFSRGSCFASWAWRQCVKMHVAPIGPSAMRAERLRS